MILRSPFALNVSSKKNRRYTLRFLDKFRKHVIDNKGSVTIDLSNLKYILPAAAILLIAEFDRAKRIVGSDFRVILSPSETPRINQLLDQIGFSALCDQKLSDTEVDQADDELVRHWRFATGIRINDQTKRAFVEIQGRLAPALQDGIWVGISEAIGNSALHAYVEPRGTDTGRLGTKRWWMLSQVKDGVLAVTVADLGIGIPRSLPLKWPQSTLKNLMDRIRGKGSDERAIKAALEVGASSTGESHRGNGLPQIWQKIRNEKNAKISIYSNRGALHWNGQSGGEGSNEFADSIFGTVISWSVPVLES